MLISFYRQRKAQSTLEYAILISLCVAAFIAMSTYVKRSVQGDLKAKSDSHGRQFAPGSTIDSESQEYGETWEKTWTVSEDDEGADPDSVGEIKSGASVYQHQAQQQGEKGVTTDDDYWPDKMDRGMGLGK